MGLGTGTNRELCHDLSLRISSNTIRDLEIGIRLCNKHTSTRSSRSISPLAERLLIERHSERRGRKAKSEDGSRETHSEWIDS